MFSASKTAGPSGYNINNSLRFRASATAFLQRTPASASNRRTFTLSTWVKRGLAGGTRTLLSVNQNSSYGVFDIIFGLDTADDLGVYQNSSGTNILRVATAAVFRDYSAWYHVVAAIDTTQATAADRVKIYVNGVQQTVNIGNQVPLNTDLWCNNTMAHNIGKEQTASGGSGGYLDGYLAEYHFIDGQALTPSSFGSTNATTGVWQPAKYTGSYGTNGFYLPFSDIGLTSGSNTGLGKDFSGNSNYWTTNNISVTSGTTYDAMTDSPTLTSATVANFPVMNPINTYSTVPTAGNLNLSVANFTGGGIVATMETPTTGKWYWEVTANLTSGPTNTNGPYIGLVTSTYSPRSGGTNWYTGTGGYYYTGDGAKVIANVSSSYGSTWTDSTANTYVIGVAYDADSGTLTMYRNNTSQGTLASSIPATGYYPVSGNAQGSAGACSLIYNFGQRPFTYTPPTGYKALNTYNLPDSTIKKGNKYMDATTYTGDGTSPKSQTNTASFKPDLVWIKNRSNAYSHNLYDSVRGTGSSKNLQSDTTSAEGADASLYGYLSAFNSNGFQTTAGSNGTYPNIWVNTSGQTYVAWQWQAGQGTTSSGTGTGGITSVTMSVNATAGFSIVTYTGSGANGTVTHGLGVAPKMIIVKNRSDGTTNWAVYHTSLGANAVIFLNSTAAQTTVSGKWGTPNSTTFGVNTADDVNKSSSSLVAYCWAEIAGFSKFGSYTGNGSTDGPFIYTGFRPKFFLWKRTDTSVHDWNIIDSSRDTYNVAFHELAPNTSAAEYTATNELDFVANGIKLRANDNTTNASGGNYIYAAFAENPFKNSLAR